MNRPTPFAALVLGAVFFLTACDDAPHPTAVPVPDAAASAASAASAAMLQLVSQGDAVAVDFAVTGDNRGWWVAGPDGTLHAHGSARALDLDLQGARLVAIVPTRDGRGVYALSADAALRVAHPQTRYPSPDIWWPNPDQWYPSPDEWTPVDLVVGPDDRSAWVLFAPNDDAGAGRLFHVTAGGATGYPQPDNWAPVAMAITSDGRGVWVLGRDGAVKAFGSAPDLGAIAYPEPDRWAPVAVEATPSGRGLWLLGASGDVVAIGDAAPHGNLYPEPDNWALRFARTPSGKGYRILDSNGGVTGFGDADDSRRGNGCDVDLKGNRYC